MDKWTRIKIKTTSFQWTRFFQIWIMHFVRSTVLKSKFSRVNYFQAFSTIFFCMKNGAGQTSAIENSPENSVCVSNEIFIKLPSLKKCVLQCNHNLYLFNPNELRSHCSHGMEVAQCLIHMRWNLIVLHTSKGLCYKYVNMVADIYTHRLTVPPHLILSSWILVQWTKGF